MDGNAQHHQHAVNRFAFQIVETGLSLEVNNATVVLGAAEHARPSADSPALAVHVRQPAETAWSLVTRHATMATGQVGTDAVQTATRLKLDGRVLHWRVVGPVARKSAETKSKPLQKHATMAIRPPAMAAAPCAQSSTDTRALDSRRCVMQVQQCLLK